MTGEGTSPIEHIGFVESVEFVHLVDRPVVAVADRVTDSSRD
ncbi:hypothetical protein [Halomontanus rarus]